MADGYEGPLSPVLRTDVTRTSSLSGEMERDFLRASLLPFIPHSHYVGSASVNSAAVLR